MGDTGVKLPTDNRLKPERLFRDSAGNKNFNREGGHQSIPHDPGFLSDQAPIIEFLIAYWISSAPVLRLSCSIIVYL